MKFSGALLISLLLEPPLAQDSYSQAVKHFDYDPSAPLTLKKSRFRTALA
jgi:hypothetical protein